MSDAPFQRAPRRLAPSPAVPIPLERLLALSEPVAKGWMLELIDLLPLAEMGRIPTRRAAREAPEFCAAVLAALGSDLELDKLRPEGELCYLPEKLPALAGAETPETVLLAVDALRAVIWAAISHELQRCEPQIVAVLAERLSYVCTAICRQSVVGLDSQTTTALVEGGEFVVHSKQASSKSEDPYAPLASAFKRFDDFGGSAYLVLIQLEGYQSLSRALDRPELGRLDSLVDQALKGAFTASETVVPLPEGCFAAAFGDLGQSELEAQLKTAVEAVCELPPLHGAKMKVVFGVAARPEDGETLKELVELAERRVLAAQSSGLQGEYPANFRPEIS